MTITWTRIPRNLLPSPFRPARTRPATPRWIADAPNNLTDAEAATFGRTHPLREAQILHEFLRAGGGAIVHR